MQMTFPCKCGKQIQIPERSSEEQAVAFIQCDECGMQYPLQDEYSDNQSDPATGFSVQDDPVPQSDSQAGNSQGAQPELELELELEVEDASDDVGADALAPLEFEPNWNVLSAAAVKRPRQETSFLQKVVPPVLGGLAALPIATAIMWYGFGRDIGTTGHLVSQYVPWIVPPKLRANRWETWDESIPQKQQAKPRSKRETLPSLNRNESVSRTPDSAERPGVAIEANDNNEANSADTSTNLPSMTPSNKMTSSNKPDITNSDSSQSVQSIESITSGISESIRMLRMLQNELYEAPKDKKIAMIGDYYRTAKKLSEQSASLRGRSASIWRKELESIAREILKDSNSKTVMLYGPIGKLPGIGASSENDFVVTVLDIGEADEPDSNNLWTLNKPWNLGGEKVSVQMLPGAWRVGSAAVPTICLVFGRLLANDSSNTESSTIERGSLTLRVHAALPE